MLVLALTASVVVSMADGSSLAGERSARLEWLRGEVVVATDVATVRDGRLALPRSPEGADGFRLAGPTLLSRRASRAGIPTEVVLVRAATVVVPPTVEGAALVVLEDREGAAPQTHRLSAGEEAGRIALWPARYGFALDCGPLRPLRIEELSLTPGGSAELNCAEATSGPDTNHFVFAARDDKGEPLEGVTLQVPEEGAVRERVELLALRRRSPASGADGRLDLGAAASGKRQLRFERKGYRDGVVDLAGGERRTQALGFVMKPYCGIGYSWSSQPRRDPGAEVVAERCLSDVAPSECTRWGCQASAGFGVDGRGRFASLPPGAYRFTLRSGAGSMTFVERQIPRDSSAPDPEDIIFNPEDWRLAGSVVGTDGRPVADAVVVAAPLVSRGYAPPASVETRSAADGSFTLEFTTSFGEVALGARSDAPVGAARMARVTSTDRWRSDLRLVLVEGGVRVDVRAREDDSPIEGCRVTLKVDRPGGAELRTALTDSTGRTLFRGLADANVIAEVGCAGRVPSSGTALETRGGSAELTVKLERASSVWLRVVDTTGRAVGSAKVYAPKKETLAGPFEAQVELAGLTGPDGRLELPGEKLGASPVFVVVTGRALGVARLSSSRCSTSCETIVVLHFPSSFVGATASSASGRTLPPNGLVFSLGGVAIPFALLDAIASENGTSASSFFAGAGAFAMNLFPAFLPPGDYEVGYMVGSKETRQLKAVPAGFLRLPASEIVELRVHALP